MNPNHGARQRSRGRGRSSSSSPNRQARVTGSRGPPARPVKRPYVAVQQIGPPRPNGRPHPPPFGFNKLEEIIAQGPEEALLTIINLKDDVLKFINTELTNDCLVLLVKLFATVSQSNFRNNVASVLSLYTNVTFTGKLETFLARLPFQGPTERNSNHYFWNDLNGFFRNMDFFCNALFDVIPKKSSRILPTLLKAVIYAIPNIEQEHGIKVPKEEKVAFVNLQVKLVNMMEKELQTSNRKHRGDHGEAEEIEPIDDFHDISIYPLSEELLSKDSYCLRKNRIKGGYSSVEEYLDIQFRLLREDFVGPLRQGIAEYLSNRRGSKRASNIKIYEGVRVLYKTLVNSEMGSVIQVFSKGHLTTRLMFGSLVAFTDDNFRNTKFCKVIDGDLRYLRKGQIVVGFFDHTELELDKNYTMLECLVYFEPYYHVLKALQQMRVEKFPLREYLVDVVNATELPGYLTNTDDLLYNTNTEVINNRLDKLSIMHTNLWPDATEMGLNVAQYQAFKAALTRKFCIIQGPPGTGKTHLALKIAKVLLNNKNKWSSGPMLVICYTNHALDQFLEGLLTATVKLVRVGGQSKNENMKKYNLMKHRRRYSKKTPALLNSKRAHKQQWDLLEEINHQFHNIVEADGIIDLFDTDGFGRIDSKFIGSWFHKASKEDLKFWLLEEASTWDLNLEQAVNRKENEDFPEMEERKILNQKSKYDLDLDEKMVTQQKKIKMLISITVLNKDIGDLTKNMEKYDKTSAGYHGDVRGLRRLLQQREYLTHKLLILRGEFENMRGPEFIDYEAAMNMRFEDRWNLYRYWLNLYRMRLSKLVVRAEGTYRTLYKKYEEIKDMYDAIYMKKCDVIGMTTTGAARLQTTLMTLNCPIVIVEEAAEVLEAHIVTALTEECQHLILIGDHKQLRPSTADYELDKKFNLGISLFERMILNGFDSNTLNIQHRMRPEIANLVCPSVYATLESHESVTKYPPIKGVEKSMFFITHKYPEKHASNSSKTNHFEATYIIMLAHYLVLNGYKPEQITILSAYSGQFSQLLKERRCYVRLEDVNITTLDSYQGEENDIILLSLVRNNDNDQIGFLSLENRVCVALSRAKLGLYIMGNIDLLCRNSKIWPKIRIVLEKEDCLGTSLPLICQNHSDTRTSIANIEDFKQVPEGGCTLDCNKLRDCGHRCPKKCHALPHSSYKCLEPCLRILCKLNHGCPKSCDKECGKCMVPKTARLPCGHTHDIPCHKEPVEYNCPTKVEVQLGCGHQHEKRCFEDITECRCTHPCEARIEPCRHTCSQTCHIKEDPDHLMYKCNKPCERPNLDCSMPEDPEHKCKKSCSECCAPCTIFVNKKRTVCAHTHKVKCHENVDLLTCKEKCRRLLQCGHACRRLCSNVCGNCVVTVMKTIKECGHVVKTECSKIPTRKDCTMQCTSTLRCVHKCAVKCKDDCCKHPCKVLVTVAEKKGLCGHTVTVPCSLKDEYTSKDALKYCKEPCRVRLACEHKCTGTCSTCHYNCLHVPCKKKCTKTLVCGHGCKMPCRTMCLPCTRPCSYQCKHSKCQNKCGDPCTECKKECTRKCKHAACSKLCHEECDVPPCSEPCSKLQKCGHPCIGYCGDPCPPHCVICTKEKGEEDPVTAIFFGTEQDEGARFVWLEECGHILEGTGLDQWFVSKIKSNVVSAPFCLKCKTPVFQTQRYSDQIKESLRNLQSVKSKFYGDKNRNKIEHQKLLLRSNICRAKYELITSVEPLISTWTSTLGKFPNKQLIENCKSKLQILQELCEIYMSAKVMLGVSKTMLDRQFNFLLEYLRTISNISNQNILDYGWELKRFTRIAQMYKIMDNANISYKKSDEYLSCRVAVGKRVRYSDSQHAALKIMLQNFNDKVEAGLNITDEEIKEIGLDTGLARGHWFKCPKGHIYENRVYGGKMHTNICPECGVEIGEMNYALLPNNALTFEMGAA